MSTHAKIIANRRNAQKSTGPRTPQGMAIASKNSIKHGLLARQAVISSEDQAEFDLYRNLLLAELAPATPMESILTERIITLSWRLRRTATIQNQAIDTLIANNTESPLARLTQSLFPKSRDPSQPAETAPTADLTLGRMAVKDFGYARVLDRLLMYERRMEHSLHKNILELQRLKLMKELNPPSESPFNQ
ncbi:MAG: hypothetical protein ACYSUV_11995 [Planctomycetota bacterium]|jgi:hypothetical protein